MNRMQLHRNKYEITNESGYYKYSRIDELGIVCVALCMVLMCAVGLTFTDWHTPGMTAFFLCIGSLVVATFIIVLRSSRLAQHYHRLYRRQKYGNRLSSSLTSFVKH